MTSRMEVINHTKWKFNIWILREQWWFPTRDQRSPYNHKLFLIYNVTIQFTDFKSSRDIDVDFEAMATHGIANSDKRHVIIVENSNEN